MVNRGRAPMPAAAVQLGLGDLARADADGLPPAAPPRQLGQGGERLLRAAVVVDELAKGHRADVVAADQAQAGKPLGVVERRLRQRRRRQPRARLTSGRQSCCSRPSSRRRMLAWCLRKMSAAIVDDERQPGPAGDEIEQYDRRGRAQRGERGVARARRHPQPRSRPNRAAAGQFMPISTPMKVATPLPPRNRSHTG